MPTLSRQAHNDQVGDMKVSAKKRRLSARVVSSVVSGVVLSVVLSVVVGVLVRVAYVGPSYQAEMPSGALPSQPVESDLSRSDVRRLEITPSSAFTEKSKPAEVVADDKSNNALSGDKEALAAYFSGMLMAYSAMVFEPDEKPLAFDLLRELNRSSEGRQIIVDHFFSLDEPSLGEPVYDLMLDADIKDSALISALIEREGSENAPHFKIRILDLIADLNSAENAQYTNEIDAFLSELASHPDQDIRVRAVSQQVWYRANKRQSLKLAEEYLLDQSDRVRAEMYEVIELSAPLLKQNPYDRQSMVQSLATLFYADYLGIEDRERNKIQSLIAQLNNDSRNL